MTARAALLVVVLGLTGALLAGCDDGEERADPVEGLTRENAVAVVAEGVAPDGGALDGSPADAPGRISWLLTEVDWTESAGDDLAHGLVVATAEDPAVLEATVKGLADASDPVVPQLRPAVAAALAAYVPDLFAAYSTAEPVAGDDALPWLPGVQDPAQRARLDDGDLRTVLADIGGDDDAARTVTGAAAVYAYYGYDHVFSGAAGEPVAPTDSPDEVWDERLDLAGSEVSDPYVAVVASLGERAVDGLLDDGFRASDGDAYLAGGELADQLVGRAPFAGASSSLAGADDDAALRDDVVDRVTRTPGAAHGLVADAVYRNLPADVLGPVFAEAGGRRTPMSAWTEQELDEWQRVRARTGAAGTEARLSATLTDELAASRG